jgi:DNA-binding transcriptional ArsR family regulator
MAEDKDSAGLSGLVDVDRLVHEPARLAILTILSVAESADFLFLQRETGLTKGNLSAHLSKLEEAGYIEIEKSFKGKLPHTTCRMSAKGRGAYEAYIEQLNQALGKAR